MVVLAVGVPAVGLVRPLEWLKETAAGWVRPQLAPSSPTGVLRDRGRETADRLRRDLGGGPRVSPDERQAPIEQVTAKDC
jgi:hypothetical protein